MSSSARKRNVREYNESMPPTKRAKVDNNNNNDDAVKLNDVWPKKKKLSNKQLAQLPKLMNPSFHKAVFQSFWNKKQFGAPTIDFNESVSKINKNQKLFRCRMIIINKQNKSEKLMVSSSNFDSKKKAQINVYQQFNFNYIPFKTLCNKMRGYSFSDNVNLEEFIAEKGDHLSSKTKTIIIEPIPLNCNEVDIINLIKNGDDIIKYIEFERDSDKAIYKKVYIEFNDEENANKMVEALNKRLYEKHKLSVTWTLDRNSKEFIKKSRYLKCVGFPLNITKNKVLQFLYSNKIEVININLIFKYSLISQIFVQFESIKECVEAFQSINKLIYNDHNKKEYKLYSRYSNKREYDESVKYRNNIKKIQDEVIRRSKCIDIYNISWDTKEGELMNVFLKCGKINKLHINHRKDLFAGSGFIEFEDESSSEQAILKLNGYNLKGNKLKISMHLKQTKDDKKILKQWYIEREEERIQNNQQRKANKLKKKKERLKRKRIRRALRMQQY